MEIMKDAAILPFVYQKVLLYRPPDVTNVYVDDVYGTYNYGYSACRSRTARDQTRWPRAENRVPGQHSVRSRSRSPARKKAGPVYPAAAMAVS